MDQNTIKNIYLNRKSYHSLELEDQDIQLQYILKFLPADRSVNILDAGCGNGRRALKLFRLNYSHISAVDLFDSIPVKEIRYKKASIENLPFEDRQFDFVYALSVIYYPNNPELPIKEFSRVLKPGAKLVISAHTKYSLFTLKRVIMRFLRRPAVRHLNDVKFKSASEYIYLLEKHGFQIILRDGFNFSFIIVPIYNFCRMLSRKYFGLELPALRQRITSGRVFAFLKSVFAYHMVIVAQKKTMT